MRRVEIWTRRIIESGLSKVVGSPTLSAILYRTIRIIQHDRAALHRGRLARGDSEIIERGEERGVAHGVRHRMQPIRELARIIRAVPGLEQHLVAVELHTVITLRPPSDASRDLNPRA